MNSAIYLHIPFCKVRCAYCDFITYAGKERLLDAYTQALCREISLHGGDNIGSVYFGGGTPSRLNAAHMRQIIQAIHAAFILDPTAEITFECNPCDVTAEYAATLAECGINRVSLGMQSAVEAELKNMGRHHSPEQTAEAVKQLCASGIDNISLDLIYGYPGQTAQSWQHSLDYALALRPKHLSLYALSVEEGSILYRQISSGRLTAPNDDRTADFYQQAADCLSASGFEHYEISNWSAAPQYESYHNRQYWLCLPYYGFGAGAHGCVDGARIRNCDSIEDYIRMVQEHDGHFPAAVEITPQDRRTQMQDCMMLGLRLLREGITPERFYSRFFQNFDEVFSREIRYLIRRGLIIRDTDGRIRLNPEHVMTANQAFMEFVD